METKFTLRDIFAYFFVGFYFLMCMLSVPITQKYVHHIAVINYDKVKDILGSAGTALYLIPFTYLIGILIHGIDNLIYFAFEPLYWFLNKRKKNKLYKWANKILFGMRIQYYYDNPYTIDNRLEKQHTTDDEFSYWQVTQQSTEGLFRVSWLFLIYNIITLNIIGIICFLLLSTMFWCKSRMIIAQNLMGNKPMTLKK